MRLASIKLRSLAIDIIVVLFCVAAWGAGYLYVGSTALTLIRLFTLFFATLLLFTRYQTRPTVYYATLLYFLLYTTVTLVMTFPYLNFAKANGFFDFLLIGLFVFVLLSYVTIDTSRSLKLFYILCMVYVPAMCAMGLAEYVLDWHMPDSLVAAAPIRMSCGFSHNPNDYAVLVTLALLYLLSYRRVMVSAKHWWVDLLYIVMALAVSVLAECRTALAADFLFVAFMFRKTIKKHWKIAVVASIALVVAVVCLCWGDVSIQCRFRLYGAAFVSLFDSYGLGFGIWGDQYYFLSQDDRDLFHGLTNAHSYLLQILFTSGIWIFLAYVALIAFIMREMSYNGRNEFWIFPVFYLFLLFAPSSSLFLWGQYLSFVFMVCYACHVENEKKGTLCR